MSGGFSTLMSLSSPDPLPVAGTTGFVNALTSLEGQVRPTRTGGPPMEGGLPRGRTDWHIDGPTRGGASRGPGHCRSTMSRSSTGRTGRRGSGAVLTRAQARLVLRRTSAGPPHGPDHRGDTRREDRPPLWLGRRRCYVPIVALDRPPH